jgi:Tol biopolymer transport system component/DNA-binding winged helix-turn-helix (wHTH) protein
VAGSPHADLTYEFGPFRIVPAERLLLRDGRVQPLTPKAFDLLVYLVQRPGHLVDKATLMAELWPDAIVEEANLSFQVSALRKVLDDGHTESVIQTVPTKGYRLVAPVTVVEPSTRGRKPIGNRWRVAALAAGSIATAAIGWRLVLLRPATFVPSPMRFVPLTTLPGNEAAPALAPDGRTVAFLWDEGKGGAAHIHVQQVGATGIRRITSGAAADSPPRWSGDGRHLAYVREGQEGGRIHVASLVDGSDRTVSDFPDAGYGMDWSADGRYFAAVRLRHPNGGDEQVAAGLFLVPADGGEARQLTWPAPFELQAIPRFSPDGQTLAFASCRGYECEVWVVGITDDGRAGTRPRRLTSQAAWGIWNITWSRDGAFIIYDVSQTPSISSFWKVGLLGGPPQQIETGGHQAHAPDAAASADRLAFVRLLDDVDIYTVGPGQPPQRWFASSFGEGSPQFSPDGRRVVFESSASGETEEIWIAQADGTGAHQLTFGPGRWQGSPRFSPDGRRVAFDSCCINGHVHVWTIDVDGGTPLQLTSRLADQNMPAYSADGRYIYFTDDGNGGRRDVWRVPSGGGPQERITTVGTTLTGRPSADDTSIIYQATAGNFPLMSVPIGGGRPRQLLPCVRDGAFAETGTKLYYLGCQKNYSPSAPVRVLDKRTGQDRSFCILSAAGCGPAGPSGLAVSPNADRILFVRNLTVGADLMLIENFH